MRAGGVKILDIPSLQEKAKLVAADMPDGCIRKAASKSEVADQISEHLRTLYDDVLKQPVPDRFLELLRQLEGDKPDSPPSNNDIETRA